jgi:dTDP-4-dehydrorhamnose 3,5-epimerase
VYKVTTVYSHDHDTGILWNSAGIPWPNTNKIISKRDSEFVALKDFKSPYIFKGVSG